MDFSKLSQVVAPDAVTEPGWSFLQQTDTAIVTTWCAVIDLARVFCSISVRKGKQKLFTFRRNRQQCALRSYIKGTFTVPPSITIYSKCPSYEPPSCEVSNMRMYIPSVSGMCGTATCLLSSTAGDPSTLPSPTPDSSSSEFSLPVQQMLAPVCQLLYFCTFQGTVL